jgi:hypothetical protein
MVKLTGGMLGIIGGSVSVVCGVGGCVKLGAGEYGVKGRGGRSSTPSSRNSSLGGAFLEDVCEFWLPIKS